MQVLLAPSSPNLILSLLCHQPHSASLPPDLSRKLDSIPYGALVTDLPPPAQSHSISACGLQKKVRRSHSTRTQPPPKFPATPQPDRPDSSWLSRPFPALDAQTSSHETLGCWHFCAVSLPPTALPCLTPCPTSFTIFHSQDQVPSSPQGFISGPRRPQESHLQTPGSR